MAQTVAEQPHTPARPDAGRVDPFQSDPSLPDVPPAVSDGGADDLLSQMAGAEIDRLLAAADVEPITPVVTLPVVAEPVAADIEPATPVVVPPMTAESVVAEIAPSAEPAAAIGSEAPPALPDIAPGTTLPADAANPAESNAAVEATDLDAVLSAAVARPSPDLLADLPPAADGRLPIWLAPLAWLNAPLAGLPDIAREAIGKVAVVTLVNAVAVLAYVAIFRHPA